MSVYSQKEHCPLASEARSEKKSGGVAQFADNRAQGTAYFSAKEGSSFVNSLNDSRAPTLQREAENTQAFDNRNPIQATPIFNEHSDFPLQLKTRGVVVEMIAQADAAPLSSNRKLIGDINHKHDTLNEHLKPRIFYAIGFNRRLGNALGEAGVDGDGEKIAGARAYRKLDNEVFGYVPNHIRWGFDTWEWPSVPQAKLDEMSREGKTSTRSNFPFRAWRELAHRTAVGHWGANEWVAADPGDRELVYKTADDDQDWRPEQLLGGLDAVSHEIGDGDAASEINQQTILTPLVLTTPYHWSASGKGDVVENEDYTYQQFLDELNALEIVARQNLYEINPLSIYYPEPTTYFTKAAADIGARANCGVLEGAAKISAIVDTVVKVSTQDGGKTGADWGDVSTSKWKTMFKFLSNNYLTSDPGARAESLVALYTSVKDVALGDREAAIERGMPGIDQSAYEKNYALRVLRWNTTLR